MGFTLPKGSVLFLTHRTVFILKIPEDLSMLSSILNAIHTIYILISHFSPFLREISDNHKRSSEYNCTVILEKNKTFASLYQHTTKDWSLNDVYHL